MRPEWAASARRIASVLESDGSKTRLSGVPCDFGRHSPCVLTRVRMYRRAAVRAYADAREGANFWKAVVGSWV